MKDTDTLALVIVVILTLFTLLAGINNAQRFKGRCIPCDACIKYGWRQCEPPQVQRGKR